MADEPAVHRHDDDGVATLTLARPARRNALSLAVLDELAAHLAALDEDPSIRVVVLAGEGPAFSAGHDLGELAADDPARHAATFARCSEVMVAIGRLRQPVIAQVAGVATAAGCQLVASCDLAVAGRSARFATPGVDIGLFCATPMVALTRTVLPKHALELLLTGELVDADHAARIGLVNRVVDDDRLAEAAAELARLIASKPAATVAAGKAAHRAQRDLSLTDAYAAMSTEMVDGLGRPEAVEGIAAFLEKRPPRWPQP